MTTHELISKLSELKSSVIRKNDFINLIEKIAGRYSDSIKPIDGLLKEAQPNNYPAHISSLKSTVNQTINIVKEFSLAKIFLDIAITKGNLMNVHSSFNAPSGAGLSNLLDELNEFEKMFEEFLKGYSPTQTLQLVTSAQSLSITLKVTTNLIDLIISKLESRVELKENEQSLSILFPSTDEFRDVLVKLDVLNSLYSELCPLFNVSASQYPLRVVKVETGSLWIYVIGNAAVIGFIVWLLKKGAGYVYRNFTTEGKILSIPKQVEAADSILEFTKKLEEAGVDATVNKEELQKTLVTVTKRLNILVANQASIEINDEVISVGQAYEQKFLQDGRRLRLEDGTQSEAATNDRVEAQKGD